MSTSDANPLGSRAPQARQDPRTLQLTTGEPLVQPWSFFGLHCILAFLLVGGVIAYLNGRQLEVNRRWVTHTHEVLRALEATLSTLKDAETGQRGWLLTNDDKYLKPYERAVQQVDHDLAAVKALVADNPHKSRASPRLNRKSPSGLNSFSTPCS